MSCNEKSKPPPAPPLPLPNLLCSNKKQQKRTSSGKSGEENLDITIERLSSYKKFNGIFYMTNTYLKPQLQNGPKCGLVALSIASSINETFTNVDDILQEAVRNNFTKQGEIFDSSFLAFLAEKCCGFKSHIIEGGLKLHLHCIMSTLLMKGLVLVPYDSDYNFSPCLKNGSKAHWAVITGFVVFKSDEDQTESNNHSLEYKDDNNIIEINLKNCSLCTCIENNKSSKSSLLTFLNHKGKVLIGKKPFENVESEYKFRKGKIYLIGLQGKSKHIGLWSFKAMAASNNNLLQFSSIRDSEQYIIPEGGVEKGLRGKAVILNLPVSRFNREAKEQIQKNFL